MVKKIIELPAKIAIGMIRFYQKTISPDHGPLKKIFTFGYCRYYPSCSEYMIRAIQKHGLIQGIFRGVYRILRCNPWSKGGIDEP